MGISQNEFDALSDFDKSYPIAVVRTERRMQSWELYLQEEELRRGINRYKGGS